LILPTPRAMLLMLAGAPVALLLGLLRPDLWLLALVWIGMVAALLLIDAVVAAGPMRMTVNLTAPRQIGVGEAFELIVAAQCDRGSWRPRRADIALAVDARLDPGGRIVAAAFTAPHASGTGLSLVKAFALIAARRGTAQVDALWLGWTGPLGLARIQRRFAERREIAVVPNLRSVREEGLKLFRRDAQHGLRQQMLVGEGSEFEALGEYQPGMDRRSIDWNASARHVKLLAKEYRIERDNRLVIAIDAGRTMSEPVDGMPRLDRAVSAALLLAYVALKLEDRVSLFHFAAKPGGSTPVLAHGSDFPLLQQAAARIDYAHEESNFTLALATLGAQLNRRALIVLFTEFTDPTSAELMIRAAGRMVRQHRLLCVVLKDAELESVERMEPAVAADLVRTNVAAELLRDRRLVIARLQRMGVEVVEVAHDRMSAGVLSAWMAIKKAGTL
jgi:uncharacterized protein (DUF58 family)